MSMLINCFGISNSILWIKYWAIFWHLCHPLYILIAIFVLRYMILTSIFKCIYSNMSVLIIHIYVQLFIHAFTNHYSFIKLYNLRVLNKIHTYIHTYPTFDKICCANFAIKTLWNLPLTKSYLINICLVGKLIFSTDCFFMKLSWREKYNTNFQEEKQ